MIITTQGNLNVCACLFDSDGAMSLGPHWLSQDTGDVMGRIAVHMESWEADPIGIRQY